MKKMFPAIASLLSIAGIAITEVRMPDERFDNT